MERSSKEGAKEENRDELQKKLKLLEEEWNTLLVQSDPRRVQLPLQLQQQSLPMATPMPISSGEVWKVRNNDLAMEKKKKIARKGRRSGWAAAIIQSGKLKGERLDFDALDDGSNGEEKRSSGHSSVLIQGNHQGIRSILCSSSSSSSSSDDDDDGEQVLDHYTPLHFHTSSSPPPSATKIEQSDEEVTSKKRKFWRGGSGERQMVVMKMMGYLAIFIILFVLGISSLKRFQGFGDPQAFDRLVPT